MLIPPGTVTVQLEASVAAYSALQCGGYSICHPENCWLSFMTDFLADGCKCSRVAFPREDYSQVISVPKTLTSR